MMTMMTMMVGCVHTMMERGVGGLFERGKPGSRHRVSKIGFCGSSLVVSGRKRARHGGVKQIPPMGVKLTHNA